MRKQPYYKGWVREINLRHTFENTFLRPQNTDLGGHSKLQAGPSKSMAGHSNDLVFLSLAYEAKRYSVLR
jgi:hypothetical protein